ncbi:phage tail tape measure protein [Mesorhizobium sp. NZP2234]|uniref:phage tail tape measure protein n=1 Tax=Mesorhizobium sp. NZP2234 TaxID=2483402 RepID=UPI0015570EB3|nr:phage tail tape measure protein [Mesorhizobium sp. NZP2234]QKC90011.1 phage tail tape measure protein [Mesorhizobium sp. NZP2234]
MAGKPVAEAAVRLTLIDRISGRIKAIQARLAALSSRLGFDRISSAVSRLGNSLNGLGAGLARTTGRLSSFIGLLGLGASGAVAGAFALAKSASDLGSEIGEASFKLGVGVESLQEYRFAAKMSGVESESLTKGIQKLGINASLATRGNKIMAKSFKALGIPLKDTNGKMRTTEAILNDTFTGLSKIKDPLRRNALAFQLFGKSGVDLVKMLSDGSEGLAEMRHQARLTGSVMSERAAKAADSFGDDLDALLIRINGLKLFLGVQLLPVMDEVIKTTTEWFDANADLVRSTISDWVKTFAQVLRDLMNPASEIRVEIRHLGENLDWFLGVIKPVVDFLGGPMQATLIALGLWTAAPLLAALASVTAAFITLGVAIMATPVGWFLAAVAAIAGAAYLIYKNWDAIAKFFGDFWDYVTGLFSSAVAYIQSIPAKLYDVGAAMVESIWNGLKSKWGDVVTWLKGAVADLIGWLPDSIKSTLGFDLSTVTPGGPATVKAAGAGAAVGALVAPVEQRPAATPAFAPTAAPMQNVMDGFASAWRDLMTPIGDLGKGGGKTDKVEAGTVTANSFVMPDPLIAHEPQQVNAPFSVTLTINAPGADAKAIASAVNGALAAQASAHAAAVQSSLSD